MRRGSAQQKKRPCSRVEQGRVAAKDHSTASYRPVRIRSLCSRVSVFTVNPFTSTTSQPFLACSSVRRTPFNSVQCGFFGLSRLNPNIMTPPLLDWRIDETTDSVQRRHFPSEFFPSRRKRNDSSRDVNFFLCHHSPSPASGARTRLKRSERSVFTVVPFSVSMRHPSALSSSLNASRDDGLEWTDSPAVEVGFGFLTSSIGYLRYEVGPEL